MPDYTQTFASKTLAPDKCERATLKTHSQRQARIENAKKLQANRGAVKRRNPKRAKANNARAYGDYAKLIRSLPCCVCGHQGNTEAAHTASGGKGRKADRKTLVPLCGPHADRRLPHHWPFVEGCHRESHRVGVKTFESTYKIDLQATALALWAEYGEKE